MTVVDQLFVNAKVFNVYLKEFQSINIAVKDGQVYWLTTSEPEAKEIINLKGKYVVPGLVDAHMHIESSMTTPTAFGAQAAQFGTTTIVADDHEIANVAGLSGLEEYMAQPSSIDVFYAIPSSVPSTTPEMETTGGIIDEAATAELLKNPRVICLGEAMNFQGLVSEPDSLIRKLVALCREERPTMPLEGHCPKYSGEDLARFIGSGITSDHTHQTPEGMIEKISNGMFIEIQAKSLTPEVIQTVIDHQLYEHVCFVTDDVMPDDFLNGHLNKLVEQAISYGLSPEMATYMATYTPARRMGLWDRGAIAPGRVADLIVLDDPKTFKIESVYKNGKLVRNSKPEEVHFSESLSHSIDAKMLTEDDLVVKVPKESGKVTANVIQIEPKSTFTECVPTELEVKDHVVQWQKAGLALLMVQERYGHHEPLQFAFVKGAINKLGAVGTTWAHDHHNLMVMGTDLTDMVKAQNQLVEQQGAIW
ncbi:adenine deaminase [Xylocopilactobacillus apis]|uniref:adenine deaminase n=1 Tax=Xylocopilactobacillus apis TaxID=2932183 RepID=A0AAU9D8U3_9LACO|nr:adenine deaminase [Xylocopilactobacillus apis]